MTSIDNGETTLESVQGTHLAGRSNADVKGLSVNNDRFSKQLPKKIEAFFPNLIAIRWSEGNLESITADDFRPFPELKLLSFGNNKIASLDEDLFKHTPRLSHIEFFNNRITIVGEDLLSLLKELETVSFSKNRCIDESASTYEKLQEIKQKLLSQCSPSTKTYSSSTEKACNLRCSLDEEFDEIKNQLAEQTLLNANLKEAISELRQTISEHSEWIAKSDASKLELLKELGMIARPQTDKSNSTTS